VNIALVVVIVIQSLGLIFLADRLTRRAREEREMLEDRLMAMSNMDSLILHKAQTDPEEGEVSYVDEQREWELSPGGGGSDGS
jgi:ribose 1,5-bisphosphokinase PhnN